jgi:hypothetical protein
MGSGAFLVSAAALAFAANLFGGDYFKRTFLEEANPLASGAAAPPGAAPEAPAATAQATPADQPTNGTGHQAAGPAVVSTGMFRDGAPGHHGKGAAKLGRDASGKAFLVFEEFSVTNGPDLHVILGATEDGGGDGLDLGGLKATDGTFSYEVPDGTDLVAFKSVTIFCKSFPTVFAVATLEVR